METDGIFQQILHWFFLQDRESLYWALGCLAAAYLLRQPLARLSLMVLARIVRSLGATLTDELRAALMPATSLMYMSAGWLVALSLLVLPQGLSGVLENIVLSVMVAAIFSALYELIVPLADALQDERIEGARNLGGDWFLKAAQVVVVVLAVASVLEVWGIKIGSAMTGLGVFGAAMALAAQDFVRNMIAGMSNMSEGRFKPGDYIQLASGEEGTVERIELRSTLLRKPDQGTAFIPNSDLANGRIVNLTTRNHRRINCNVPLRNDTTRPQIAAIRDGIATFLDQSEDFIDSPDFPTRVRATTVTDEGIILLISVFTRTRDYTEFLAAQEALMLEVVDLVEASGAHFSRPLMQLDPDGPTGSSVSAPSGTT